MQTILGFLARVGGRAWTLLGLKRRPIVSTVIVHNPDADGPHDLDDPFFSEEVQKRMAGVIARNARPRPTEGQ
jgi:hypothetical protein